MLLVEDEVHLAVSLVRVLQGAGAREVDWAPTPEMATAAIPGGGYDIVVSEYDLGPGLTGLDLLAQVRQLSPAARLVCTSGAPRAVPAWCSFVLKDDIDALKSVVTGWQRPGQ